MLERRLYRRESLSSPAALGIGGWESPMEATLPHCCLGGTNRAGGMRFTLESVRAVGHALPAIATVPRGSPWKAGGVLGWQSFALR